MFDSTTYALYAAAGDSAARAQAVRDSLGSGTLTVELRDGATVKYTGTCQGPLTAGSDGSLSYLGMLNGVAIEGGTPNAATWTCTISNASGRSMSGSFGPGGRFTCTAGAIVAKQRFRWRFWATPPTTQSSTINVSTVSQLYAAVTTANGRGGVPTVIQIAAGTYTLTDVALWVTGANTTIRGAGKALTIIRGDAMTETATIKKGIHIEATGCVIEDLSIERVGWHCVQVAGEYGTISAFRASRCGFRDSYEQLFKVTTDNPNTPTKWASNGIVEDCDFEYTAGIGPQYYIGGIDCHAGRGWIARRNTFKNIASPSGSVAEHAIHFWNTAANCVAERNKIVNCDRGIGLGNDTRGTTSCEARNNMIYHAANSHPFADVGIDVQSSVNPVVVNNTVILDSSYTNAIEYRFAATTGATIRNNLTNKAIAARDGASGTVSTNYTAASASWFIDPANGDLRLKNSYAGVVDAGATIGSVTVDYEGDARPQGAAYDIGADEYTGATITLAWGSVPSPITLTQGTSIGLGQYVSYNGAGTLSYSVQAGSLPSGVTLSTGGTLSATSGAATGTVTGIVVRVSDGTIYADTASRSVTVNMASGGGGGGSATTRPLVIASNLAYVGSFRLPDTGTQWGFAYAATDGGGMGLGPNGSSLYVPGFWDEHDTDGMAEVSIPTLGTSAISSLPIASLLQAPRDPLNGQRAINNSGRFCLGGALVSGSELILAAWDGYDGGTGSQNKSHWRRPLSLSSGTVTGPVAIPGLTPRWVGGHMCNIPTEWQSLLGMPALTGVSGINTVGSASNGPSAALFDPTNLSATGKQLVGYPVDHDLAAEMGSSVSAANNYFNLTMMIRGMAFPEGTRSVLFFGIMGLGAQTYGIDPVTGYHGFFCDSSTYAYRVWAYDANDLLAVKNGTKTAQTCRPYSVWSLSMPYGVAARPKIGGAVYDPGTHRIYLAQSATDGVQPVIHAFQLTV